MSCPHSAFPLVVKAPIRGRLYPDPVIDTIGGPEMSNDITRQNCIPSDPKPGQPEAPTVRGQILKLKDMGLVTDPELIELLKMEDTFEAVEGGPRSVAPVTELVKHAQQ